LDDHLSGPVIADRLKRPTRRVNAQARHTGILGLAGGGVFNAINITADAVRSCRTISPLPRTYFGIELNPQ